MTPEPTQRFTVDGDDALESHLAELCDQVHLGVSGIVPPHRLRGILLGGGYGRGEGGVLHTPEGQRPYNDLEFYVFTPGPAPIDEHRFRRPLHALGERLGPRSGLDVEFKVLSPAKLRRSAPSMFYYDLVLGHRWIAGDDGLLRGCDHLRDPSRIPLHEATRLLLNRTTGLLFAAERLARPTFGPDDADFVGRNLAKACLAFGDIVLAARGLYHASCRERHRRLADLAASAPPAPQDLSWDTLLSRHAEGVAFKLHPFRSTDSRETLARHHDQISTLAHRLWLWLEGRRLGQTFSSGGDYARSRLDKCPETSPWRNRLINFRTFGLKTPLCTKGARYPRERLLHSLPLLLWEFPRQAPPPDLSGRLRWELMARRDDLPGWVAAYERLWHRFN